MTANEQRFVRVFFWRPAARPPMEIIGQAVSEIFARDREFHMREYAPGCGCWWIVSDYEVDDDEAKRLYEAAGGGPA